MNRFVFCSAASLFLLLIPSMADANCGDGLNGQCYVGATGQGGTSSGGKAQGFFFSQPSIYVDGATYNNTGNNFAGHINVTGAGTISGSAPGSGNTFNGHATGLFGDWSGQCAEEDFLCE